MARLTISAAALALGALLAVPAHAACEKVRFSDVDNAGIVYYPRFFHYCHVAREEFFTELLDEELAKGMRTSGIAEMLYNQLKTMAGGESSPQPGAGGLPPLSLPPTLVARESTLGWRRPD